jgi:hypothetical protein
MSSIKLLDVDLPKFSTFSEEMLIVESLENFLTALRSFWITSGIIYPFNFISKDPLTVRC